LKVGSCDHLPKEQRVRVALRLEHATIRAMPRELNAAERESLSTARMFRKNRRERDENSALYRWAGLVIQRHKSNGSITNANDWLEKIMAGIDPKTSPEMFME
jgi:hypothetical protein